MKNKEPEEFLRQYDCKIIDDNVYFELKYAVNALDEYVKQYKADNERLRKGLIEILQCSASSSYENAIVDMKAIAGKALNP